MQIIDRLRKREPAAGPWRVERLTDFARVVLETAGAPPGRPPIAALDGRSASGKTRLAGRLQAMVPGAVTVHTDDVAWWHSRFDWTELLATEVLEPLRKGQAVAYRPPAWEERNRPGAIEAPADATLVIIEGVGAGRRETADLVDTIVWVQSDLGVIARRIAARVAAGDANAKGAAGWMREEFPFVAGQRSWERAFVVVAGAPDLPHDPSREVVLAPCPK